jgi:8-oxo-dGTP pyrophosphatase MutT (NUDIX family)
MTDLNSPRPITDYTLAEIRAVIAAHSPNTDASAASANHAGVAMVLHQQTNGRIEVLFIKRAEHPEDPWSGHMAFPGGWRDPEDHNFEAAARRETFEELQLTLTPEMLLGRLDDVVGERLRMLDLTVVPFVYHCPSPGDLIPNEEVAEVVWIPLSFLANPANVQDYHFPPDPLNRAWPAYFFGPYTVWGLTYRIIANFLHLFGHQLPTEPAAPTQE